MQEKHFCVKIGWNIVGSTSRDRIWTHFHILPNSRNISRSLFFLSFFSYLLNIKMSCLAHHHWCFFWLLGSLSNVTLRKEHYACSVWPRYYNIHYTQRFYSEYMLTKLLAKTLNRLSKTMFTLFFFGQSVFLQRVNKN